MTVKKNTMLVDPAAGLQKIEGIHLVASIKDGWRTSFVSGGRMMLVHPDHQPRIVDLGSIKEGDILPRDDDEILSYAPPVTGN